MSSKVAFVGTEGIYAETAAQLAFSHQSNFSAIAVSDFDSLDSGLKSGDISHAIIAIENSLSGTFTSSLDFLIKRPHLHITSEVVLKEINVLLAHENTKTEDITEIIASPQAIDQCRTQVLNLLNGKDVFFKIASEMSTLAQNISKGEMQNSAILADPNLYASLNLVKISQPLGEYTEHNFTRFFVVSTKPAYPEKHQLPKTTIAITLKNTPGALMKIFSVFALRDLNVCKVESRASARSVRIGSAWEYTIVVDVDGAPQVDKNLHYAIENLKEFSTDVHVLGSYPRFFDAPTTNLAPVGL